MDFKLLGSILLIVGTSIGAGMLALPIATAQLGFFGTVGLLLVCWSVMTAGAFLLLEVNLWLPQNSNLVSMAKLTLGRWGQGVAWVAYILLLYSLLCAYISGGSDLLRHLLESAGMTISLGWAAFLFTVIFGGIVYLGIRAVDYVNRGLMFFKLGAYVILVSILLAFVNLPHLEAGHFITGITSGTAWMVTMTSFGFATIVPSLRIYFAGDVAKLRKAILIGSLVPLVCYIAWVMVIMGIIPLDGDQGLIQILHSNTSTSDLIRTLSVSANATSVTALTKFFTSVCVLTSFLGVALCLTDFLADGLRLEKVGASNTLISLLAFVPPLVIVLFWPNMFIRALAYAGVYCLILLVIFPALMVIRGRAKHRGTAHYTTPFGWVLPALLLIFSIFMLIGGGLTA